MNLEHNRHHGQPPFVPNSLLEVLVLDVVVDQMQLPVHLLPVNQVLTASPMSMELLQSVVLGLQGATVDHVLVVGGDIKLPGFPSVCHYGWLRSVRSLGPPK